MASITRYLPLLAVLVISTSNNAAGNQFLCRRLYPLEVTASRTPCRYYCAHFGGWRQRILILGEQDGTPCVAQRGSPGVCRSGICLNTFGSQSDGSRKIPISSQMPLRIRKREIKGLSAVKNSSPGSSMENSGHLIANTLSVKTAAPTDGSMVNGMKTVSTKGMPHSSGRSAVTPPAPANLPEDINLFALPSEPTSSTSTNGPLSAPRSQAGSSHVPGAEPGAFNTAENGPVGTTKPEVTKGSLDTLTYPGGSIHQPSGSSAPTLLAHVPGTHMPGLPGGMSMPTATGVHPRPITGSTIRSGTQGPMVSLTSPAPGAPVGFSNAPSPSGVNSRNAGIPTPFTTTLNQPHPGTTTPRHIVPAVGVTGSGLEVEVPGFTTGLDGRWKWVLARRTGIFPPYIQAIDPEILYYKLGYPLPNLPALPEYVQKLLNNVPMSPAGSSIYGYRGSTTIIDIVRKVARIAALKKLLSSSQTSHRTNQTRLLATLLAREISSPLGASPIERLLLQGDSQSSPVQPELWSSLISLLGSNPYGSFPNSPYPGAFGSPYSTIYGGIYGRPYGPLSGFPNAPLPRSSWPYYAGSPLVPSGTYGPRSEIYSSFSSYNTPSSPSYPGFPGYGGSPLSRNILSTLSGMVSGTAPGGTTPSVVDPFLTSGPIYSRIYNLPRTSAPTTLTEVMDRLAHPWQSTPSPDGGIVRRNDAVMRGLATLSPMLRDPTSSLYNLLKSTRASKTSINSFISPGQAYPDLLNWLREKSNSPIINTLIKQVVLRQDPGGPFSSLLKSREPNGNKRDGANRMIALLQSAMSNRKDAVAQYLAQLAGIKPDSFQLSANRKAPAGYATDILTLLRSLQQRQGGRPEDPLAQLLLRAQESQRSPTTRNPFATADYIGTPQDFNTFPENQPNFPESRPLAKSVDDTFLTVSGSQKTPVGAKNLVVSKPAAPSQFYASTLPRHSVFKEQLVSHTSSPRAQPATSSLTAPVTSGLHVTKQVVQQLSSPMLLRVHNVPGVSRGTLPFYTTNTLQPFYTTGPRVTPTPGVFINGQYVSTTNGLLGTTLGQTGLPLPAAAYTAGVPVTTGYVSATTSSHPYLLDTSPLGIHPHYIVEGHEAPGTRWQLKVWRNHPGVSAIVPGMSGYTSYVSSSPTMGLLGQSTPTGIPVTGSTTSSHYYVQSGSTGGNHILSPISSNAPSGAYMPGTQPISGTTPVSGNSGSGIYATSPMTSTSYTRYSYSSTHGSDSNSGLESGRSGGESSNFLGTTETSSPSFSSSSGSNGMNNGISNTKMKR